MKTLGILLITLGLFVFVYHGVHTLKHDESDDLGPAEAAVVDRDSVSIPIILGLLCFADGTILLVMKKYYRHV